tara:strand:+ start:1015 stop:1365 length:351 start_codon:yes stop_codon:yes gene_type:complete
MQRGGKRRRSGNRRKPSSNFISAGKPWQDHIKETMRKNPNMKFGKSLLKLASRTYKKGSKSSNPGAVNVSTSKFSVHVKPKTKRADIRRRPKKNNRTKRRTSRKKRSTGLGGIFGF